MDQQNNANLIKTKTRNIRYTVRLSSDENKTIMEKSTRVNCGISSFLRECAMRKEVKATLTEEEKAIYRQLVGVANNLNQLAKSSKTQSMLILTTAILTVLNDINIIINKFRK